MRIKLLFLLIFLSTSFSKAQLTSVYSFLGVPVGARQAALGGRLNANPEFDPEFISFNPALLAADFDSEIGLSYVNYFADINFGSLQLPMNLRGEGGWYAGLTYASYGSFEQRDPNGALLGEFQASDYAISIGHGRKISRRFSCGANLKAIASYLEAYESYALAIDASVMYMDTANDLSIVLSMQNLGSQLSTYTSTSGNESLPLDLQLAASKKLKHLPLRWGLVYHHIQRFDIQYQDPNDRVFNPGQQVIGLEEEDAGNGFGSKFLEHLGANLELNLGRALDVRLGYDHLRRSEMKYPFRTGSAGFSFGFGLNLNRLSISYGNSRLNLAGTSNHFSLQWQLGREGSK